MTTNVILNRLWRTRSYFKDEGSIENMTFSNFWRKTYFLRKKNHLKEWSFLEDTLLIKIKLSQKFDKSTSLLNLSSLKWDLVRQDQLGIAFVSVVGVNVVFIIFHRKEKKMFRTMATTLLKLRGKKKEVRTFITNFHTNARNDVCFVSV